MRRFTLFLASLTPLLFLCGCAPIKSNLLREIVDTQESTRIDNTGKYSYRVGWKLKGYTLEITSQRRSVCDVIGGENHTIQPTQFYKINPAASTVGIAMGLGGLGLGASFFLFAIRQPPLNSQYSRDELSREACLGLGAGFAALGTIGIITWIASAARAKPVKLKKYTEFARRSSTRAGCGGWSPAPSVQVDIRIKGEVRAAKADGEGRVTVALDAATLVSSNGVFEVQVKGNSQTFNVTHSPSYKMAVEEMARAAKLKAEEAAKEAKREKERKLKAVAEARVRHAQLLKKLKAKMLKRPKVMYAKGIDPSCEMPNMPCSGAYLVEGKEYKVVARTPNHWGIAECDDQAPCMLADVRLWTLKRHLETTQQRKRRQLKTRRTLALKQNLRTCRQLRSIGWRGSCRLVRSLVKAGYTLSRSLNVARRIHSKLLMAARQPGKEKGVISCLSSGNLTQTILRVERGATESNVDSLAFCHRKRGGARLFAKAFRITQGDARAILQIYKGK